MPVADIDTVHHVKRIHVLAHFKIFQAGIDLVAFAVEACQGSPDRTVAGAGAERRQAVIHFGLVIFQAGAGQIPGIELHHLHIIVFLAAAQLGTELEL